MEFDIDNYVQQLKTCHQGATGLSIKNTNVHLDCPPLETPKSGVGRVLRAHSPSQWCVQKVRVRGQGGCVVLANCEDASKALKRSL